MIPAAVAPPELSVIVPTYNRAAVLERCLEAMAAQDCPTERFEVIVADDGSTDDTRKVAEMFVARSGPVVRYLHQMNSGANTARNRAIAVARGRLLLFINDDTIPAPGLIREHLSGHEAAPDDRIAVLGRVTVSPEVPPSRLAPLHLDRAFEALGEGREFDWRAFFTCNVSVKKSLLERGGMFEERIRYHEDLELSLRLSRQGLRVVYRPEALGFHYHHLTEEEFLRVAAREARALAIWSGLAPDQEATLASLGFEPALPWSRRLKHRLVGLAINAWTRPLWCAFAARVPIPSASLVVYDQVYQSVKRAELKRALRERQDRNDAAAGAKAGAGG